MTTDDASDDLNWKALPRLDLQVIAIRLPSDCHPMPIQFTPALRVRPIHACPTPLPFVWFTPPPTPASGSLLPHPFVWFTPPPSPASDSQDLFEQSVYITRLYVTRGIKLTPKDPDGLADPFLVVRNGRHKQNIIDDVKNSIADTLNPNFYRCFELPTMVPGNPTLTIEVRCLLTPSKSSRCLPMPSHSFEVLPMPSDAFSLLRSPPDAFRCLLVPSKSSRCLPMPPNAFSFLRMPSLPGVGS